MAQMQSGIQTFDPNEKDYEKAKAKNLTARVEFERMALNLIVKVFIRNMNAGKRGDERFYCYAIHRRLGIHRRFNLCMQIVEGTSVRRVAVGTGENQESVPVVPEREYGGALNNAETMLQGEWRLATLEEEPELAKKDEAESVLARDAQDKAKHGSTSAMEATAAALEKFVATLTPPKPATK